MVTLEEDEERYVQRIETPKMPSPVQQPATEPAEERIELESILIHPGVSLTQLFETGGLEKIRKNVIELFSINLSSTNYDADDLRLQRLALKELLLVLDIMMSSKGKIDLRDYYNSLVIEMHGDAAILKGKGGWANIIAHSEFSESKTIQEVIEASREEKGGIFSGIAKRFRR